MELRVIKADLPDFEEVELYVLADLHIGDPTTDEQMIKEFIRYIMDKPNRYVILNGDIVDNALTVSVSDTYSQKYSPSGAITHAGNILRPVAKRILAIGPGNHEDRTVKITGIDISSWLAKDLECEKLYTDNSFVLFVKFGKSEHWEPNRNKRNVYSIFSWHGSGGGRKPGGKMNRVQSMQETVDADLYIMSHVHTPMTMSDSTFNVNYQNMTISQRNRSYLISNAWQDFGGYGQKFGFTPISREITYAVLNGHGRKHIRTCIGIKPKGDSNGKTIL